MVSSLTLEPNDTDATIAARLRKALRAAGNAPLSINGALGAGLDDAVAAFAWLSLLTSSRNLVLLEASGPIGQRGMALILACDVTFAGPDCRLAADWGETLGLAVLATRRGGAALARQLLFGGITTLDDMAMAGLIRPPAAMDALHEILGDLERRKRSLRAASALPFDEALTFDLAFLGKETAA